MDKIRIEGIPVYNGDWDLDISYFTMRELHTIKQIAGVRAGELFAALDAGDTDVFVAMAVIALQRSKRFVTVDTNVLWDADYSKISFMVEPAAVEGDGDVDDPPASPPLIEPGDNGNSSEQTESSGDSSRIVGDIHPERILTSTGNHPSETGSA